MNLCILTKLTRKTNTPQEHLLKQSAQNSNKHVTKLTLTIIQVILYEIWETRNNNKYDKKLLLQQTIITKINTQLKRIIKTHYKKHEVNDTVNLFKEIFCIN